MINETTQAGILVVLGLAAGIAVDADTAQALTSIPVDGTTLTGGGVGVAVTLIARGFFKRLDDAIKTLKTIANHWIAHTQRTENLHRVALRLAGDDLAVPSESMDADTAPIEIDERALDESGEILIRRRA